MIYLRNALTGLLISILIVFGVVFCLEAGAIALYRHCVGDLEVILPAGAIPFPIILWSGVMFAGIICIWLRLSYRWSVAGICISSLILMFKPDDLTGTILPTLSRFSVYLLALALGLYTVGHLAGRQMKEQSNRSLLAGLGGTVVVTTLVLLCLYYPILSSEYEWLDGLYQRIHELGTALRETKQR